MGSIFGGHGGIARRRDFDGVRRRAFGRRIADRARFTVDPRSGNRSDDHRGRIGAHASLPDSQFSNGHGRGHDRGGGGIVDDQFYTAQVHGYTVFAGGVSGGGGWSAGVYNRDFDWEFVRAAQLRCKICSRLAFEVLRNWLRVLSEGPAMRVSIRRSSKMSSLSIGSMLFR